MSTERSHVYEALANLRLIGGIGLMVCADIAERIHSRLSSASAFGQELPHLVGPIALNQQVVPRGLVLHLQRACYLQAAVNPTPFRTLTEGRAFCLTSGLLNDTYCMARTGARQHNPDAVSFEQLLNVATLHRAEAEQDPYFRGAMLDALDIATAGARTAFDQVNFEIDATSSVATAAVPSAPRL